MPARLLKTQGESHSLKRLQYSVGNPLWQTGAETNTASPNHPQPNAPMVSTPAQIPADTQLAEVEVPIPPTNLPYDDGEPLETAKHRTAMNVLIRACQFYLSQNNQLGYCGGNTFLYYSAEQVRNQDFRGPDFFLVLNAVPESQKSRKYWAIWDEGGRYPDLIIELMSPSTAKVDTDEKKELYQSTFRTQDYIVYDPNEPSSLQGWTLDGNLTYQALKADNRGWLWCQSVQLWVGTWQGEAQENPGVWLRFYDRDGNLVLLPEELEAQRAEEERQRAKEERQRAEEERQRAENAEAENARLRALLQQQGIDLD
ncbi:MAG: Uma2 family endonuclease [Cyanobacteriota bacterium]|nr:Uma2 family endonuclease [Cyanobacteriota bacterium]